MEGLGKTLYEAARAGENEEVKRVLKEGGDPNWDEGECENLNHGTKIDVYTRDGVRRVSFL